MPIIRVTNTGQYGVNKDLSLHEMPVNSWSDCRNIRFLDGVAYQFYGHSEVYAGANVAPQHVLPVTIASGRYWIYLSSGKAFAVTESTGTVTHTDITHVTPLTGAVNSWTSCLLAGVPIINAGNTSNVPAYWDMDLTHKFVNLSAWPASTYCKSFRAYNNYGIALNVTKSTTNYPHMVKWSHPAEVGTLPSSWDHTDATKDAGEFDLAGNDYIVDGGQLRDTFIIYKEASTWRMDYIGGPYVFRFQKLFGMSGVMNRNCWTEFDGWHLVLTGSDIIIHDGNSQTSILDKKTRRWFFQDIDATNRDKCFVFKNPFLNEIFIAYPAIGSSVCDKAVVYNYVDKTVSFRDLPNINHAAFGHVNDSSSNTWANDADTWAADLTKWNGGDYTPDMARVIMASSASKLYLLDGSASFAGTIPTAYLERKGLSFGQPESRWLVKGVRPRITGNTGSTVTVSVGYADDPYAEPTYTSMTHTIGTTVADDCLVSGRYIAVKFATGTAYQWRLDSFDIEVEPAGMW